MDSCNQSASHVAKLRRHKTLANKKIQFNKLKSLPSENAIKFSFCPERI